mmetsp:Transcript_25222/g.44137  ORF Transcript_25222/g.44137 Transcript_25222/m.44137 type:complete len:395 (-) Transcript_25222:47-1231(-)|eukprot:CAMPEP_0204910282 /NCGR_PEP_ID=MMETSP1397-20131031/8835_1 /ASSEMBLY_ACC=CAM_ASM_000891 /TAXON_ID=49980 /ORGANISM="Climacostomum Climacostomum virens, Strain Stock W-24" /LENGTH=394 /DNA_ID=CAMNT_0052080389 /DNA_START=59 /DNA_END=1243 /DNA_ORIENTATION=+
MSETSYQAEVYQVDATQVCVKRLTDNACYAIPLVDIRGLGGIGSAGQVQVGDIINIYTKGATYSYHICETDKPAVIWSFNDPYFIVMFYAEPSNPEIPLHRQLLAADPNRHPQDYVNSVLRVRCRNSLGTHVSAIITEFRPVKAQAPASPGASAYYASSQFGQQVPPQPDLKGLLAKLVDYIDIHVPRQGHNDIALASLIQSFESHSPEIKQLKDRIVSIYHECSRASQQIPPCFSCRKPSKGTFLCGHHLCEECGIRACLLQTCHCGMRLPDSELGKFAAYFKQCYGCNLKLPTLQSCDSCMQNFCAKCTMVQKEYSTCNSCTTQMPRDYSRWTRQIKVSCSACKQLFLGTDAIISSCYCTYCYSCAKLAWPGYNCFCGKNFVQTDKDKAKVL